MVIGLAMTALPTIAAPAPAILSSIDLATPFHTRSPWRFIATQGTPIPDSFGQPGNTNPGPITLCLSRDGIRNCEATLLGTLGHSGANAFSGPHFLRKAEIYWPDTRPLLLIQSANLPSGDGDYGIETIAFRYHPRQDRFIVVYRHVAEHNRNGDVRYITNGPLHGDFISAEATGDAPFGYWVAVNRLGTDDTYHLILRYRSATQYGDNNPLAVIDSEMPNIEQHLNLWAPSRPLPLPLGKCPAPHLVHGALWCQ